MTTATTACAPSRLEVDARCAWPLWVVSRLLLFVVTVLPVESNAILDVTLYFNWSRDLWQNGILPGRDFPLAAPLLGPVSWERFDLPQRNGLA